METAREAAVVLSGVCPYVRVCVCSSSSSSSSSINQNETFFLRFLPRCIYAGLS